MKDVVMVAHFTGEFNQISNNRFNYLADLIAQDSDLELEVITSSFSHENKAQRIYSNIKKDYKLNLIFEPTYKKNVSIKRLMAHYVFSENIKTYLSKRVKPDLIYCAVPSIAVAKVISKYCKLNNVKLILDIQDLWPEAFKMVVKNNFIYSLLSKPLKLTNKKIYKSAHHIFTVSETYKTEIEKYGVNKNDITVIYLGTNLKKVDEIDPLALSQDKRKINLVYCGTLGHSYDLISIFQAIAELNEVNNKKLFFHIIGDGPLLNDFMKIAKKLKIPVKFYGRIEYDKMIKIMKSCDLAINPIKKGSAGSIINKVCDYAACKLPVLNTQESVEYRNLVETYNFGVNANCEDIESIKEALKLLLSQKDLVYLGNNNYRLALQMFDRQTKYLEIVNKIGE